MDEPSNSELAWRLERLQDTANGLIGRPEFTVTQAGTERRIDDVERDLAELKVNGFARVREVEKRIDKHEERHTETGLHWRTLLWTGALPAVAAIAAVFLTFYLSHH